MVYSSFRKELVDRVGRRVFACRRRRSRDERWPAL